MSKNVQMSTMIGGQAISIGQCLPAQARILVRKGHARWQDGGIVLSIRPVHLEVAMNHKKLDHEEAEVSNAELERRIEWLKTLMVAQANADTGSATVDRGLESRPPLKTRQASQARFLVCSPEESSEVLSDEEAAEWFTNPDKTPAELNAETATELWHGAYWWDHYSPENLQHAFGPYFQVSADAVSGTSPIEASGGTDAFSDAKVAEFRFQVPGSKPREAIYVKGALCPRCGIGIDTDGDGHCQHCARWLKPR